MQEMSAPESTSMMELTVFRVYDGEISYMGIFMDLENKDTRTGDMVITGCRQGTLEISDLSNQQEGRCS